MVWVAVGKGLGCGSVSGGVEGSWVVFLNGGVGGCGERVGVWECEWGSGGIMGCVSEWWCGWLWGKGWGVGV